MTLSKSVLVNIESVLVNIESVIFRRIFKFYFLGEIQFTASVIAPKTFKTFKTFKTTTTREKK